VMADKDGSGAIDMEELKHCLKELKVEISEKEVEELHAESDMDSSHAIEFKEFIVLLALVYLLGVSSCSGSTSEPGQPTQKSRIGLPQLEFGRSGRWQHGSECRRLYPSGSRTGQGPRLR
jgi:calcium-binding protein CML